MAVDSKDVLSLQMFTTDRGVAVAFAPARPGCRHGCLAGAPSRHRDYLVATTDGGVTWRVTGALPSILNPAQSWGLRLAFTKPQTGFVQSTRSSLTLFTNDAGRTWSSLTVPGQPTALSLNGGELWIVSNSCPTSTTPRPLCRSRLLTYRTGHRTPSSDRPIPTKGITDSPGISSHTRAAAFLDRLGRRSAVVEEGGEGAPSRLLLTTDSGLHWALLTDPCEGLIPTGLVAPTPTRWVLHCELDGGMNQGTTRLYTSTDHGKAWTLTAQGDMQDPRSIGTLGDAIAEDLTASRNGHVLWLLPTAGGISHSTDEGTHWTTTPVPTGGYQSTIATAGPTSAWLPLPGVGLYHTANGTTWTRHR